MTRPGKKWNGRAGKSPWGPAGRTPRAPKMRGSKGTQPGGCGLILLAFVGLSFMAAGGIVLAAVLRT